MTKTPELPELPFPDINWPDYGVSGWTKGHVYEYATAALQQANEMAEGLSRQNEALHRVCLQKEESIAAAERERDALAEALRELVAVKDLEESRAPDHDGKQMADYYRRKPLAWEAAHAVLEGMTSGAKTEKRGA